MSSPPPQPSRDAGSAWDGLLGAWLGFVAGVVVPLAGTLVLIEQGIDSCEPYDDWCGRGFEYLWLIPVLFAGLLVIGPVACFVALRVAGQRQAGATGWRCTVVVIGLVMASQLVNLVVSVVPGYPSSPLVAPLVGSVAAPLLARRWALAGQPPEEPSVRSEPRGSTWESAPAPVDEGQRDPGW